MLAHTLSMLFTPMMLFDRETTMDTERTMTSRCLSQWPMSPLVLRLAASDMVAAVIAAADHDLRLPREA